MFPSYFASHLVCISSEEHWSMPAHLPFLSGFYHEPFSWNFHPILPAQPCFVHDSNSQHHPAPFSAQTSAVCRLQPPSVFSVFLSFLASGLEQFSFCIQSCCLLLYPISWLYIISVNVCISQLLTLLYFHVSFVH